MIVMHEAIMLLCVSFTPLESPVVPDVYENKGQSVSTHFLNDGADAVFEPASTT